MIETVRDVYDRLHKEAKELYLHAGKTEDEANRGATIYAITYTWQEFNDRGIE